MPNLEWKKIDEALVYDGYRKIIKRRYQMPDGSEANFEIVCGFPKVAVIFALTPENGVIITKEFRPGPGKVLMELPGGAVEPDEELLDAAKRELLEETGYQGEITMLGKSFVEAYTKQTKFHFIAKNCKKIAEKNLERTEFIEETIISLADFKKLVRSGELTDSDTALYGLMSQGISLFD
ncbi:MAG: NUDIX hydrolase [Patescibacteria group bacterium]